MTAFATQSRDDGSFHVVTAGDDGRVVLRLTGELDCDTAPILREALDQLGGRVVPTLVLQLANLKFIDSSGLHELVTALSRQRAVGGEVVLDQPSAQTMCVLDIAGLSRIFTIRGAPSRETWVE